MTSRENWPDWALKHFPENSEEANTWNPYTTYYSLHSRVLVVARTRIEGSWIAYCANVPGISHRNEVQEVLDYGCRIGEHIARQMFPEFDNIPYAD